ncbi:MAG: GNAT family N-acetyltransferase [Balneolales bacterium]|nr:GNAT family N-acetyltransferase [Balneolales bacterium]
MATNSHSREDFGNDVAEQERIGDVNTTLEESSVEIKIITNNEDFRALQDEWSVLAEESETHIFQTYEWNHVWWKHFGASKNLHIAVVYVGNKMVGIAPLFEDDVILLGRKVYTCLRFIGSYVSQPKGTPLIGTISYSDYLDFIIHPKYEILFFEFLLEHFNKIGNNFDEIILDDLSEKRYMSNTMTPLMEMRRLRLPYSVKKASSCPIIPLDPTWDDFLNSMNVKERYNARRYFNRSNYGKSMAFRIVKIQDDWELNSVLETLKRMHQIQWNNRGFAGTFSEDRMYNFFVEISKVLFEKSWIEFALAIPTDDDINCVAVDVYMTYKKRVYLMHRGLEEDSSYRKLGPGNVLLFTRINEAIKEGVQVFDMLRGSEEFKLRLAKNIVHTTQIVISSDRKSQRLRASIIKKYLKVSRQIRNEKSHVFIVFKGKTFSNGLSDYMHFLHRRIKKSV